MGDEKLIEAVRREIVDALDCQCADAGKLTFRVIAAIRSSGYAILATSGPEFEAAVERANAAYDPYYDADMAGAIRAALNQPTGETDA